MFICGTLDGLIPISGRRHNTEDIIATVMAVEPHSFIYKGRFAAWSVQGPICAWPRAHVFMYIHAEVLKCMSSM